MKLLKKIAMGQSRQIICNDCGNQWERLDGKGTRSAIYYCDLCDNRKSLFQDRLNKEGFLNPANLRQCECGGTFMMDATIRCPKCKSTDVEVGFQELQWN